MRGISRRLSGTAGTIQKIGDSSIFVYNTDHVIISKNSEVIMGVLINATTAAGASEWFGLTPGVERGIIASGLAGSETVKLQVRMSDGSIADTGDQCTASAPSITIRAANQSDSYRVLKSPTAGSVLVDLV